MCYDMLGHSEVRNGTCSKAGGSGYEPVRRGVVLGNGVVVVGAAAVTQAYNVTTSTDGAIALLHN